MARGSIVFLSSPSSHHLSTVSQRSLRLSHQAESKLPAVSGVTFLLSRYHQISDDADKHPTHVQSRNETNEIPVSKLGRKTIRTFFSLTRR
jgi:hypothetical protein